MKQQRYIIWIEGLTPKTGEKVKEITRTDVIYTTKMKDALRVNGKDITSTLNKLKNLGVKCYQHSFIKTSYTPAGTLQK